MKYSLIDSNLVSNSSTHDTCSLIKKLLKGWILLWIILKIITLISLFWFYKINRILKVNRHKRFSSKKLMNLVEDKPPLDIDQVFDLGN